MQRRDFITLFGVVRVNQDGRLLARAEINVPGFGLLARDQIQAIPVSADAQRLWLTVRGRTT
jgi:hypothetical protein